MQLGVQAAHRAFYSLLLLIVIFCGNVQLFLKQHRNPQRMRNTARKIREKSLAYRQLQVSEKIINSTFRTRVFLPLLCALSMIQILSGLAFLTLFHSEGPLLLAIFLIAWLDSGLAGVISLSANSVVYVRSQNWIMGRGGQDGRRSYGRKVVKSYRPLRLDFGSNFIDRLTPLVMQEFCIRNMATLLLMRGQGRTLHT